MRRRCPARSRSSTPGAGADVPVGLHDPPEPLLRPPDRDEQRRLHRREPANTYAVSYSTANGEFRFERDGPNEFRLRNRSAIGTHNISEALGGYATTGWVAASSAGRRQLHRGHQLLAGSGGGAATPGSTATPRTGLVGGGHLRRRRRRLSPFDGTRTVINIESTTRFRLSGPTGGNLNGTRTPGTITCDHRWRRAHAGGTARTNDPAYTLLYRADTAPSDNATYGDRVDRLPQHLRRGGPPGRAGPVTNYQLRAGRYFNGEVIRVTDSGQVCDMTFPTAADRTNPPSDHAAGGERRLRVRRRKPGRLHLGRDVLRRRLELLRRLPDPRGPGAVRPAVAAGADPVLARSAPGSTTRRCSTPTARSPTTASAWTAPGHVTAYPAASAGGIKGYGSTPIASSLAGHPGHLRRPVEQRAGRHDQHGRARPLRSDPIRNHLNPKEKTIVLFVTDGDDTCAEQATPTPSGALQRRLRGRAAVPSASTPPSPRPRSRPTSSATAAPSATALVSTGSPGAAAASATPAPAGQPDSPLDATAGTSSESTITNDLSAAAGRVHDLRGRLHRPRRRHPRGDSSRAIIDQGASDGEFNAQQSITESIFEYVDLAPGHRHLRRPQPSETRYKAIVPTRFISSFTLPGFRGQLKAYQNDGAGNAGASSGAPATSSARWSSDGMATCDTSAAGGAVGRVLVRPAARRRHRRDDRDLGRRDQAAHLHDRRATASTPSTPQSLIGRTAPTSG